MVCAGERLVVRSSSSLSGRSAGAAAETAVAAVQPSNTSRSSVRRLFLYALRWRADGGWLAGATQDLSAVRAAARRRRGLLDLVFMEVELVLDNTKGGTEGPGDASGTGCGGWGVMIEGALETAGAEVTQRTMAEGLVSDS